MTAPNPAGRIDDIRKERLAIGLPLFLFALLLVRTSWLCDDAYLTFRTVDNVIHGYGPRWNIDERVQAYTHPLWMLLLSAVAAITRELYLTPMLLSLAVSVAAIGATMARSARSTGAAVIAAVALMSSRAFVDYSMSGLENPLTHLLLAFFAVELFTERPRLLGLTLLAALGMTNRLDTALLFAPGVLVALLRSDAPWKMRLRDLALGALPLVLWESFSLFYYGFLFPNTAYAKLGTGIGAGIMARQGLAYAANFLRHDPLGALLVLFAILVPLYSKRRDAWPLSLGVLLYLLYIIKIGGDFMSGRFFTPLIFIGALHLSRFELPLRSARCAVLVVAVAALGLLSPKPVTGIGPDYDSFGSFRKDAAGVTDERAYYHIETTLLGMRPGIANPRNERTILQAVDRFSPPMVYEYYAIGMPGFFSGRDTHLMDLYALSDPLLARLPALRTRKWRIGHFERLVPVGYRDTLMTGVSHFEDEGIARYYEKLRIVNAGPLVSVERFKTIAGFLLGRYEHWISVEYYANPTPEEQARLEAARASGFVVEASRLDLAARDGDPDLQATHAWMRWAGEGVRVNFSQPCKARELEINVSAQCAYRVTFWRAGKIVGSAQLPEAEGTHVLRIRQLAVPDSVGEEGFDMLDIRQASGGTRSSLAWVKEKQGGATTTEGGRKQQDE